MNRMLCCCLMLLVSMGLGFAQEHQHSPAAPPSPQSLGTVQFATSCAPATKNDFTRAVALLHSFEYDAARDAFLAVEKEDPNCAMAYWGAAMTYFHPFWGEIDEPAGSKAAAEAREKAAANSATTAREKQYVEAVSAIYANPDATYAARTKAFSNAMAQVSADNAGDDEAAIFYAMSLHGSEGHDATYANDRKCGEILEPIFKRLPNHPGVAHYLIHCYDNEALAQRGLFPAREYAKIAPASAHATHMPSHIFVRLGLWQDTINSNVASMRVAESEPGPCHERGAELHAMHFLQFAYLQLGRQQEARQVVEHALALPTENNCQSGAYVAAAYALHSHEWQIANELRVPATRSAREVVLIQTAIGISAARTGNLARAQQSEKALEEQAAYVRQQFSSGAKDTSADAMQLEVAAWIAHAQHEDTQALEMMRKAEEIGGYSAWLQPLPAEQLGDLLVEQNNPREALAAYRKALDDTPNLFNALYGAAKAADAAGDSAVATEYYRKLVEVANAGDRPEIAIARKKLDASTTAAASASTATHSKSPD